ncbi:MAG: HAMP domain-containing protein, partial [Mycobacteriales bacterium]
MSRRQRVPSLQMRLALVFAGGALALSALFSLIAFAYSRSYLLRQLQEAANRQTFANARLARDDLLPGNLDITTVLTSIGGASGSESVVEYRGRWYASSLAEGRAVLPPQLVARVLGDQPARQRFALPQGAQLAVGVPLPEVHGAYFAIFPLGSLDSTLHAIAVGLLVAAAATTGGGAVLGYWTSRRLARPILEVAQASTRIAEGQLETRLSVASDRELATLSRAFNEMADALQSRIERDSRFVADVSHELRSPLTTLAVTLSLLQA